MSVLPPRKKPIPAIVPENVNNTATSSAIIVDPTPGELNSTAAPAERTADYLSDADVDAALTNDDAPTINVSLDGEPIVNTEADANRSAQLEMPIATIDLDKQGDFPLELGTVEASANYPDGSRVCVTVEGGKFRREAAGEPYFSALIRGE